MEPGFAVERRESPFLFWIKRLIIVVVCVHVVLSAWSTYRRIWQVLRIDLRASSTALAPGAPVASPTPGKYGVRFQYQQLR